ncbi:DUF1501 domain-containing protein [Cognatiyoonia sp. IB215446]|uniref:DUF1501 domain-containing protein n=1 Tax=Cognatiyoonia sp. IB215446 TaxID=3097355 RepID=UPI002A17F8E1|nr:DUF1501 domain-containing protein [Cognatiyoonia sp. IB215446]MDX8350554.1 DUF1501 domain-containing protein [Cognatiyoonia sp. IB215446]
MTTRREFLKSSAIITAASMAGVAGAPQFAFGQSAGGKTLIKVFMRGGADGLHLFPAVGDPFYYQHRPNIAIEPPSDSDVNTAIDIGDNYRGMNPNLEPLMEIWDAGRMMVAPSTALESGNRSHFDNQRWIGNGARNNLIDGYLNRYMQEVPGVNDPLRGAVLGKTNMSAEASGNIPVPAIQTQSNFELENGNFCSGNGCADNQLTEMMREISSHPVVDNSIEATVRENQVIMLDSIAQVQASGMNYTTNAGGLEYSNSRLGRGLRLAAQLLKAGVPLEVAAIDWNIGWDTHANQIPGSANRFTDQNFNYHRRMREGATDFLTFYRDIANILDDVVVIVGTEFGRTVLENGSRGTDHGHSSSWFAFGGPTAPGVADDITTLDRDQLRSSRFTPTRTEYQDIVGEIMIRHMNMDPNLVSTVFPGHTFTNHNLFSRTS